ncbi:MAG: hypothetical protein ABI743_06445, partial [bacterium]
VLVLSIDLDFFVDPTPTLKDLRGEERLSGDQFKVMTTAEAAVYLSRWGLAQGAKPRARYIRTHIEAFDILANLETSVDLVHVDGHADLGVMEAGHKYLMTMLMASSENERRHPKRGDGFMTPGNWLAFAIAARAIKSVRFVPRHYPPKDLLFYYFADAEFGGDPSQWTDFCIPAGTESEVAQLDEHLEHYDLYELHPDLKACTDWRTEDPYSYSVPKIPDFVVICHSPSFTPSEADEILELIRSYLDETEQP